ncbi:MAG: 4-(cytidine 5'-diphospho)-2-C-methyl-D-erythritol kinase [Rhodothermia bacterium]|nr:4-(cytidine 5'-diphospho)-2-C-methyl-D-erythritol kinase [Rhodothermia bacterium]
MFLAAPAKINLGLQVLRKRSDGFHDLETVFLGIQWADRLTFSAHNTLSLTCSDPLLPTDERNLCLRAALMLQDHFRVTQGCHIHLDKNVPYGAGLGGGSSDAATVLLYLTKHWQLPVTLEELTELAVKLGSDVPFFLHQKPMFATGRGEILSPLVQEDGAPYAFPFHLVVAMPQATVSTPLAYRLITPNDQNRPDLRQVVTSNDPERWRQELVNDFQKPILAHFPEIQQVATLFQETNAIYTSLSGSGAAFFGVYETETQALEAKNYFGGHHILAWSSAQ